MGVGVGGSDWCRYKSLTVLLGVPDTHGLVCPTARLLVLVSRSLSVNYCGCTLCACAMSDCCESLSVYVIYEVIGSWI
jgi:hypothetical protein